MNMVVSQNWGPLWEYFLLLCVFLAERLSRALLVLPKFGSKCECRKPTALTRKCVCVSNDLPWPAMEVDRVMGFLKGICVFQNPPIVRLHDWRAALAPRGLCWHVRTCSGHSCYRESNHLLLGRAGGMGLSVANAKHQSQAADTNRSPEMRPFELRFRGFLVYLQPPDTCCT